MEKTFTPGSGTRIDNYKTLYWKLSKRGQKWKHGFACKFAHSYEDKRCHGDPIPEVAKKLYSRWEYEVNNNLEIDKSDEMHKKMDINTKTDNQTYNSDQCLIGVQNNSYDSCISIEESSR